MSSELSKDLPQIVVLIALIGALLFVLANFGYIRPCDVPVFGDIYFQMKGHPQIAILYGDDGMGNPELLKETIIRRTNQFPEMLNKKYVIGSGSLDRFSMIIVEHAKTLDTSTLVALRDFVQKGGRLVWVGDAGTALGDNDYICEQVTFSYRPSYWQRNPQTQPTFNTTTEQSESVAQVAGEGLAKVGDVAQDTLDTLTSGSAYRDINYPSLSFNSMTNMVLGGVWWLGSGTYHVAEYTYNNPGTVENGVNKAKDNTANYFLYDFMGLAKDEPIKSAPAPAEYSEVCAPKFYTETPEEPKGFGGICGRTFGELVVNYNNALLNTYEQATTGGSLCSYEKKPFIVDGADNIKKCESKVIDTAKSDISNYGRAIGSEENNTPERLTLVYDSIKQDFDADKTNADDQEKYFDNSTLVAAYYLGSADIINQICSEGIDYWNRGPSETATGSKVSAINFGRSVLGLEYVSTAKNITTNLFMTPVDPTSPLTKGYETQTKWFGVSQISKVDASLYPVRTNAVMTLQLGGKNGETIPAVVTSQPVGPLVSKTGLVTYFAFPPEIGATEKSNGRGINLIDNLLDSTLCV